MREVSIVICNHETQTDRQIRVAGEGVETITLWAKYGDHDLTVMPDAHGFRLTFRPDGPRAPDKGGLDGIKFIFDAEGVEMYTDRGRLDVQENDGKVYVKALDPERR